MKIGVIVQARTSSTRLHEKILKDLPLGSGVTVLQHVIRRLQKSKKIGVVIIATSTEVEDSKIADIAVSENAKVFRGSLNNVLERYYLAAKENDLDIIVRVTSDCPCIDARVVDMLIDEHIRSGADYSANNRVRKYSHGLDAEVISFKALEKVYKEAETDFDKEHVCPYIYMTNPSVFKIGSLEAEDALYGPDIRITLDTKEDYDLLCEVFNSLYVQNEFFDAYDVIALFKKRPDLKLVNKV